MHSFVYYSDYSPLQAFTDRSSPMSYQVFIHVKVLLSVMTGMSLI